MRSDRLRNHALRSLAATERVREPQWPRRRSYGESIRETLIALWEASDLLCNPTALGCFQFRGRYDLA